MAQRLCLANMLSSQPNMCISLEDSEIMLLLGYGMPHSEGIV